MSLRMTLQISGIMLIILKMSKEIDAYWKNEVINILEWLKYNDELFDRWIMNKISSKAVYNRYLDEMKK